MTDQLHLFDPPGAERGPVRIGLEADLSLISDADREGRHAIIAMALESADAADAAHRRGDAYALTAATRELRQCVELLPISIVPNGGPDADPADAFWASMSADIGHAPH